jgi:hypothetical protein
LAKSEDLRTNLLWKSFLKTPSKFNSLEVLQVTQHGNLCSIMNG